MSTAGYEFFEHTADIGLQASGSTLAELFTHAALGLTALLIENGPVASREKRPMALEAGSVDELLVRWLKELLFWFATDRFLPGGCAFERLTTTELRATVSGEPFDPARHASGTEIKGVTYHQLEVRQQDGGWQARVILDV